MGKFAIADELRALTKAVESKGGGSPAPVGPGKHIYGVRWGYTDGIIDTAGTRTDEAADFDDPVPYVSGEDPQQEIINRLACGSPFDVLYPWNGMAPYMDILLGSMVAIPKFYFRWTKTDDYLQLQVATYAADGFSVSPAHMDRGDGKGERDAVYIARYHAGQVASQSLPGMDPLTNITRADLRTSIEQMQTQVGASGYSMQDYAMFWTWRMLYLVEYANWNGQAMIGYGTGNGNDDGEDDPDEQTAPRSNGTTDRMVYHTGTMQTSKDTPGQGVQYRWIEDPWGGVAEWIDGWYMAVDEETGEGYSCIIMNPDNFSDTEGGIEINRGEEAPNGWITDWEIPDVEGCEWALIPFTDGDGGPDAGVADYCGFDGPALLCGGAWLAYPGYGGFYLYSGVASNAYPYFGARLQKLP